jgi:hypothetical protein
MATLIITVASTVGTTPLATLTAILMLKVRFRSNSLPCQCTTVARPLLRATEVLGHNNHKQLATLVLKRTVVHQSNRCKASSLVSR